MSQSAGADHLIVREIIHHSPALKTHIDILNWIVADTEQRMYMVGTRYDIPCSSFRMFEVPDPEGMTGIIHINSEVPDGCDALWDLTHEFGHTLQDPPPDGFRVGVGEEWLDREEDAWTRGWTRVTTQFPPLQQHKRNYNNRQKVCMNWNRRTMKTQGQGCPSDPGK